MQVKTALTIGGSDPCGAAGIQADLKVFAAYRVYGMSVITAITSQNSCAVSHVMALPGQVVESQLRAIYNDIPVGSLKIGMLSSRENITLLSEFINEVKAKNVVLDPIIRSSSGAMLIDDNAIDSLVEKLFPRVHLVTPNIEEASFLARMEITGPDDMKEAARIIARLGPQNVLVKGGHLKGKAIDILYDGAGYEIFQGERIRGGEFRGTGCALSSAIAAGLTGGSHMIRAVKEGKDFVRESMKRGFHHLGKGMGILNHNHPL
ncbi:MAG: bifunctional hydroxymethylpyrimidine kinase/phosphomethylpyrimidine kinase [Deltaproteobacteria bacterium]|nr:bifunctional hydroxymethylpyrimidine kinase/phosphomethylpyrimidine kinase [Deltaproteobacteria bacterium]